MCGIAGIYYYAEPDYPVDRDVVVRMTRALTHRGPDAEGFHFERGVGLGHRRLSIVDLSPTGAQPMSNRDDTCWITYNGEFYNHSSFRERLTGRGHHFRGPSDTETLLHLMEEYGPDALSEVSGIFGFAFWNGRSQRLTLGRDPLGVKQVYYHDDGRRIVFASEIKALLLCPGVPREPDMEGINQYLHFHSALFERTFFKGIRQLRAGEYLEVGRFGARSRSYWSISDFTSTQETPQQLIEHLRVELADVVKDQLMSDVPVGSFFSGGIDSSAVAAFATLGGKRPTCFGVHFSDQGVTDERPYQETAAKALGLDLQLITMNGSSFPEDMTRLMYFQDEPVIGAAMFPMYYVSQLAAGNVKVCLGGQGADEIFGGYARYALGQPSQVLRSWFTGRHGQTKSHDRGAEVSGNLRRQFSEKSTIYRLLRNAGNLMNWEKSYFENFAKVPESTWAEVFASPDFYSRERCRQLFHDAVTRSPATHPADKIMHWDAQTYLTGLFHQDDRMSMACSLESRVPLADPRLVKFAFRTGFDLKFRGGASKWILRQAVSDILPESVLTRRKVGFDTPAEAWMKGQHAGFVREMLLSTNARQRGFWNSKTIEDLLAHPNAPGWFDIVWKVISIETWASVFLDGKFAEASFAGACLPEDAYTVRERPDPAALTAKGVSPEVGIKELFQEGRELGPKKFLARSLWEAKTRSGLAKIVNVNASPNLEPTVDFRRMLAEPREVAEVLRQSIGTDGLSSLALQASEATRGRILCFGAFTADFGNPIDWHRNPLNQNRWRAEAHWSRVLADETRVGDVKLSWEVARFPQAFAMARCATFFPEAAPDMRETFLSQVRGFLASNPAGMGIHWNSGQEITLRLMAWLFAFEVFGRSVETSADLQSQLINHLFVCASHIEQHIEYARDSVYNNHLLSEALALYIAGTLLPATGPSSPWRLQGVQLLEQQATRQFYPDGAYIQQSHNYHRFAVQIYLWAMSFAKANGDPIPVAWNAAVERSLDFLVAQQNPLDGRLPNYGANDGALPLPLSSCEFGDFRPTLQAASILTRQERIYDRGPWDEMSVWLCGSRALELPLRRAKQTSVCFSHTGHHVLRGRKAENFATFRCGTILDRFSQIDMLHLDVWWRGHNVLVDAGSYLYNGPEEWHDHFLCTESHNTVQVDGRDQMLHYRKFKCLYWTEAQLLRHEDNDEWALCQGEHYGFQRNAGRCVHRRTVLFVKDECWVVVDRIEGVGAHDIRLQWLGGDFPYERGENGEARLQLITPAGPFHVAVFDPFGRAALGDIVAGQEEPPRGWLSRTYAQKVPVPSLAVELKAQVPLTLVSILGPAVPHITVSASTWSVTMGERVVEFELTEDGIGQPRLLAVA